MLQCINGDISLIILIFRLFLQQTRLNIPLLQVFTVDFGFVELPQLVFQIIKPVEEKIQKPSKSTWYFFISEFDSFKSVFVKIDDGLLEINTILLWHRHISPLFEYDVWHTHNLWENPLKLIKVGITDFVPPEDHFSDLACDLWIGQAQGNVNVIVAFHIEPLE